jgi:hypothetical protein
MTAICIAFLNLALALSQVPAGSAERRAEAGGKWEYRILTREQVLDLGRKDLAAGLNQLGGDSWELAAVDGVYIFKRPRDQGWRRAEDIKSVLPLLESEVELLRDRAAWAERMVKKGFMTERQAEAERLKLRSAEISLERARRELLPGPQRRVEPPEKERKPDKGT